MNNQQLEKKLLGNSIPNKPNLKRNRTIGIIIIVVFFGIFGSWAAFSPLESAAIAPGKVIVAGYRREIQHLEGGIVQKLFVKAGTFVQKGQALVQLENTRPQASHDIVINELLDYSITEARIKAELEDKSTFHYPTSVKHLKDKPKAIKIYNNQLKLFTANQKAFKSKISILDQRKSQLEEQQKGEQAQLVALKEQQALIKTELKEVKVLYDKRLIERSKLLNLMREKSRLAGQHGEKIAKIATIKQKIGETNTEIIATKDNYRKELLSTLKETQSKLRDATERQKASHDILKRTTIRSPQTGTVVNLKVTTIGQVLKPGEVLMAIVPKHEELVVDAEINLNDIDVVKKGLSAKVQLSAFQTRTTPALLGKVTHVSADTFTDEKTGKQYYRAVVVISPKELKKLGDQSLYPGMPAEVMIITNKLTPLEYFFTPIHRSFNRAFREQ